MVRIRITRYGVTEQIPGAREKGGCSPYQELTQVPLAEKAKACRSNSVKGIRQISSVTSGEGAPR